MQLRTACCLNFESECKGSDVPSFGSRSRSVGEEMMCEFPWLAAGRSSDHTNNLTLLIPRDQGDSQHGWKVSAELVCICAYVFSAVQLVMISFAAVIARLKCLVHSSL